MVARIPLPVRTLEDANRLAQAIVKTIPEPFLVLDADLRVLEANRSFYEIFKVELSNPRLHALCTW